ncbi:MAG: hypothetical protein R2688_00095 [Fimbriimonadaceae bacterium]
MLWREHYNTTRKTVGQLDWSAVNLFGEPVSNVDVVLGGFALEHLVKIEVWRRLFESERPDVNLFCGLIGTYELDELGLLVPPSWHGNYGVLAGEFSMIEPQAPFCWHQKSGEAWIGLATEDAWDEVLAIL